MPKKKDSASTGLNLHHPVVFLKEVYSHWRNDRTLRLGASIAYYGVFAIIPVLVLMVAVASYFFSTNEVKDFVANFLQEIFGENSSISIEAISEQVAEWRSNQRFSSIGIIGFGTMIITASFIFLAVQDALDSIFHKPVRKGWKRSLTRYLLAYLVVLITSSVLFFVLLINSIATLSKYFVPGSLPALEEIADLLVSMGSWALGIFVLSLLYKLLIYDDISWKVLLLGSSVTSILIVIGTWGLSFYISNIANSSLSGALGGVSLLLIWIYYEAQILMVGGQLIKVLAIHLDGLKLDEDT